MLNSLAHFLDRVFRRHTPDPFIFAVILTFLVIVFGSLLTEAGPTQMIRYWGEGFWNLIPFTLQMVMILVGGYVVASTPLVERLLKSAASLARGPREALVLTTVVSMLASWINWGLGLVVCAFFSREITKVVPRINFPLLVACAYSGFITWHAGMAGSIPLLLATPGNFSEELVGRTIPVDETIFSNFNLTLLVAIVITLPIANWALGKQEKESHHHEKPATSSQTEAKRKKSLPKTPRKATPVEWLENTRWVSLSAGLLGMSYVALLLADQHFQIDLNQVNFIFLFTGLLLHRSPRLFLNAMINASKRIGSIILQFPFYSGIMGMMTSSGLALVISQPFVELSTPTTFPFFTFLSAGLFNLFVPSGGGQWAMQGPIIIPAAQELGVDISKAAMAVAWGDAWTNLLQPFWALPVLAIAGLRLRDIMGYCVTILFLSGIVLGGLFLIL